MTLRILILLIGVPGWLTWIPFECARIRQPTHNSDDQQRDSKYSSDDGAGGEVAEQTLSLDNAAGEFDGNIINGDPDAARVQDLYKPCVNEDFVERSFRSGHCCRGSELVPDVIYRCQREPGLWMCHCSMCADLLDDFHVTRLATRVTRRLVVTYHELTPKTVAAIDGVYPVGPRYILYLLPEEDINGAFGLTEKMCERIRCFRDSGYHVFTRRVSRINEAEEVLNTFPDGSLHHVSLGGHGTSTSIEFGSSLYLDGYALSKMDSSTHQFLMLLRQKLLPQGASVFLDACKNAKSRVLGLWNMWQYVASKLPGTKVIASKSPFSDKDVQLPASGVCLPHDAIVVKNGKNVTAVTKQLIPNCKRYGESMEPEIAGALLNEQTHCLSRCGQSCIDAQRDIPVFASLGVKLTADPAVTPKHNPCMLPFRKTACRVAFNGLDAK
eukprot:TRINITY_DN10242_c0_g1_i1.p1 TRINITY_DN10242_c0_g1~~TRINITY_DN10242_c0_g1_i1.p1  ORF type:complete len:440 (-),score=18.68 TRINITY_DN10242_c0_g1_i1:255-1574(-)